MLRLKSVINNKEDGIRIRYASIRCKPRYVRKFI